MGSAKVSKVNNHVITHLLNTTDLFSNYHQEQPRRRRLIQKRISSGTHHFWIQDGLVESLPDCLQCQPILWLDLFDVPIDAISDTTGKTTLSFPGTGNETSQIPF